MMSISDSSLSYRERVVLCCRHQETDRVPRDLMGNATMLLDACYLRLRDYLDLSPIPPVRQGTTANYYDERILERFDIDFRRLFLPVRKDARNLTNHGDGTFSDAWGLSYRKDGLYLTVLNHPLAAATTPAAIDEFDWPVSGRLFDTKGLSEFARRLHGECDYALVARNPFSPGFIDRASQLMGTENFLVGLYERPEIVERILSRILEIYLSTYSAFLEAVGPYVQVVETADDIGTQSSLIMSPESYRQFIKPLEKQLYNRIHELAPNAFLFRHSDGALSPVMEDLIEVGVDILNPVQTSASGMAAPELKAAFGDRLCFHGAIEGLGRTMPELEHEVAAILAAFKPGGGYILAPCNHIVDTTPENIMAMYAVADRHGRY
jgi:uroporphyrinogen decarboxylase